MLSQRELLQFHRKDRPKRDRIKHKTPGGKRRVFRQRNDWIKFCEETFGLLVDHDNPYKDNPPHVNQIELFLRWNARRKKGTLSDTGKISVRTLQNDWDYLRRDIKDLTGFRYSDVDLLELETVIAKDLRWEENLTTAERAKPLADGATVIDLLRFHWFEDEYEYAQPRFRIQLPLAIIFLRYLGLRTGEMVQGEEHLGDNEGLHWGDFDFSMEAGEDGARFFSARISIRNRKGRRNQENEVPIENLREDRRDPYCCPMILILTLAIADRAIEGVESSEDLDALRFDPCRSATNLKIRDQARNTPVLRQALPGNGTSVSTNLIMSASALRIRLKDLGHRAGYVEDLVPYAFRRGYGNALDKKITAAERNRFMGHRHGGTFSKYMSRVAPCDVQNILNGREPDQNFIDYIRSMRARKDYSAPIPAGSLITDLRYRPPGRQCLAVRQEYKNMRVGHFAKGQNLFEGVSTHVLLGSALPRERASPTFLNYLRYDRPRAEMRDYILSGASRSTSSIVGTLLAVLNPPEWYYPEASPDANNCCARCGLIQTQSHPDADFKLHLLACECEAETKTHFCFSCSTYFDEGPDWESHCDSHILREDFFCGLVKRRGIILQAALCPFCIGNTTLPSSARLRQFTDPGTFIHHLEDHLSQLNFTQAAECPHPLCSESCSTAENFWQHITVIHGVWPPKTRESRGEHQVIAAPSSLEQPLRCKRGSCETSCNTVAAFIAHSKTHPSRICPLERCGYSTRSIKGLRQHLTDHGYPEYVCMLPTTPGSSQYCGHVFSTYPNLRKHQDSHSRRAALNCASCGKQFRKQETLQLHHQVSHLGEKPFACDQCDQRFTESHIREWHVRAAHPSCSQPKANGELAKPKRERRKISYICSEPGCGKILLGWNTRQRHLFYTHQKGGHVCDLCSKLCRDRSALDVHVKSHQNKVVRREVINNRRRQRRLERSCWICKESFEFPSLLKKHVETRHPGGLS